MSSVFLQQEEYLIDFLPRSAVQHDRKPQRSAYRLQPIAPEAIHPSHGVKIAEAIKRREDENERLAEAAHCSSYARPRFDGLRRTYRKEPCDVETAAAIRVDSGVAQYLPVPEKGQTTSDYTSALARLPPEVRSSIFALALTSSTPIMPPFSPQHPTDPPLALALPTFRTEIIAHLSHYLTSNAFAFNLASAASVSAFQTWLEALGDHAWSLSRIALHYQTTWTGPNMRYIQVPTITLISRHEKTRHLLLTTEYPQQGPESIACDCSLMRQLATMKEGRWHPGSYAGIKNVREFGAAMRDQRDEVRGRLNLGHAARDVVAFSGKERS